MKDKGHKYFEKYAQRHNMRPVVRVTEEDADILIADSGEPFYGENADGQLGFWYRTAFAFLRDKAWIASSHEYPAGEFALLSKREGQERRVNDCLECARTALALTVEVGLYD